MILFDEKPIKYKYQIWIFIDKLNAKTYVDMPYTNSNHYDRAIFAHEIGSIWCNNLLVSNILKNNTAKIKRFELLPRRTLLIFWSRVIRDYQTRHGCWTGMVLWVFETLPFVNCDRCLVTPSLPYLQYEERETKNLKLILFWIKYGAIFVMRDPI